MKILKEILQGVEVMKIVNKQDENLTIQGLSFDSRKIKSECLFVAEKGAVTDGHLFIEKAIQNGANVVVLQDEEYVKHSNVVYVLVKDSSKALAQIAKNYFDDPSSELTLVGITGTNGKTTTVTLLYELFTALGYKCGKISTVENIIDTQILATERTTPDSITINSLLRQMVDVGCQYAFMEVSSHSVVQNRIYGLNFKGAIFSNITLDHLDYHKTFAAYIKAKKKFFDDLSKNAFAITNMDDKNGLVMLQNTKAKCYTYSLENAGCDFKAKVLEDSFDGLDLLIEGKEIFVPMVGKFNAYNILAVYSTAVLLGADKDEVLRNISLLKAAKGRFEIYKLKTGAYAIIDYAHTPDAVENVLKTITDCRKNISQKIFTLIGCGGNRDKSKRPIMANISYKYSDVLILTSDNPRDEDPEEILKDMQKGLEDKDEQNKQVFKITDRREAIHIACNMAKQNDIILIAGKGHENYQEIKGIKYHFDDKEEVMKNI